MSRTGTDHWRRWDEEQSKDFLGVTWGFPKIRVTILVVPIIRIIVFRGLYCGPLIFGKLPHWGYKQNNKP